MVVSCTYEGRSVASNLIHFILFMYYTSAVIYSVVRNTLNHPLFMKKLKRRFKNSYQHAHNNLRVLNYLPHPHMTQNNLQNIRR